MRCDKHQHPMGMSYCNLCAVEYERDEVERLQNRIEELEIALAGVGLMTPYPQSTTDLIYECRAACEKQSHVTGPQCTCAVDDAWPCARHNPPKS